MPADSEEYYDYLVKQELKFFQSLRDEMSLAEANEKEKIQELYNKAQRRLSFVTFLIKRHCEETEEVFETQVRHKFDQLERRRAHCQIGRTRYHLQKAWLHVYWEHNRRLASMHSLRDKRLDRLSNGMDKLGRHALFIHLGPRLIC